jgi:hypothetical protein
MYAYFVTCMGITCVVQFHFYFSIMCCNLLMCWPCCLPLWFSCTHCMTASYILQLGQTYWEDSCSRNNQHYALICTTPLLHILAPTCFSSSLPSSGSFLGLSKSLEMQIEWVVYHIMCGYLACVLGSHGSICCASLLHAEDLRSSLTMAGYCQDV